MQKQPRYERRNGSSVGNVRKEYCWKRSRMRWAIRIRIIGANDKIMETWVNYTGMSLCIFAHFFHVLFPPRLSHISRFVSGLDPQRVPSGRSPPFLTIGAAAGKTNSNR